MIWEHKRNQFPISQFWFVLVRVRGKKALPWYKDPCGATEQHRHRSIAVSERNAPNEWQSATAATAAAVGLACHASRLLCSLCPEVRSVSGTRLQHRQQQQSLTITYFSVVVYYITDLYYSQGSVYQVRQPATSANLGHSINNIY